MQSFFKSFFLAIFAALAAASAAVDLARPEAMPAFDHYQIILDRKPFGETTVAPAGPTNAAPVTAVAPFAMPLAMTSICEMEPGNVRVGLFDTKIKRSYLLSVGGEPEDGIQLVSADVAKEEAVLRRGTEMSIMKLATPTNTVPTAMASAGGSAGRPSFDFLRRQRENQPQTQPQTPPPAPPAPAEPKLKGEELEKHLRQYNLEAIRQGLPPLPIQLSAEEDKQLVTEGVLPAAR